MECLPKITCWFPGNSSKTINKTIENLLKFCAKGKERVIEMRAPTTKTFKKGIENHAVDSPFSLFVRCGAAGNVFGEVPLPLSIRFDLHVGCRHNFMSCRRPFLLYHLQFQHSSWTASAKRKRRPKTLIIEKIVHDRHEITNTIITHECIKLKCTKDNDIERFGNWKTQF